jgi:hypothetical protein
MRKYSAPSMGSREWVRKLQSRMEAGEHLQECQLKCIRELAFTDMDKQKELAKEQSKEIDY